MFLNKPMNHSYSKDLPSHYLLAYRCNRDYMIYDDVDENDGWVLIILHLI